MKALVERYDDPGFPFVFLRPKTGELDGAFVGFRPRVGEEALPRSALAWVDACVEKPGQKPADLPAAFDVVIVAHVDEP